jgi:dTDP-4-dehydrorhamnose 3,5-epimerase
MKVTPTNIPDVLIIEPEYFSDSRGFFIESFNQIRYQKAGVHLPFVQDNHSGSKQGVLRGLHYQIKHPQGKLVNVIKGEVYDVVVDIRQSSQYFGQYHGVILSEENRKQLWVPPGFAHGFYVISDWAEFIYKVTDIYSPDWERSIVWDDPTLGIDWPIKKEVGVIISEKDSCGVSFEDAEKYQ